MKYKIIPDDIVKNMIEFLDEIQFEAAQSNKPDDLHRINFINYLIGELMNGIDGFDLPEDDDRDADIEMDIDLQDRYNTIDDYKRRLDFPEDMSEEEWKKLIKQFDSFVKGWDKEYKKSNHKDKGKKDTLKNFAKELKMDRDLTPEEKFELYYSEYKSRKVQSLNSILKELGIKKPQKK